VVRPWPRLPREAVAAPSLAVLKTRLDGALRTLGWWKMSLPMAGGWNWMICKLPPNPTHSVFLGVVPASNKKPERERRLGPALWRGLAE